MVKTFAGDWRQADTIGWVNIAMLGCYNKQSNALIASHHIASVFTLLKQINLQMNYGGF